MHGYVGLSEAHATLCGDPPAERADQTVGRSPLVSCDAPCISRRYTQHRPKLGDQLAMYERLQQVRTCVRCVVRRLVRAAGGASY
jgi:hypothetical protein